MARVLIEVEKRHVKAGVRCSSGRCPVALVLNERFGNPRVALEVGCGVIMVHRSKDSRVSCSVYPRSVKRFDAGLEVLPFRFFLPERVVRALREV